MLSKNKTEQIIPRKRYSVRCASFLIKWSVIKHPNIFSAQLVTHKLTAPEVLAGINELIQINPTTTISIKIKSFLFFFIIMNIPFELCGYDKSPKNQNLIVENSFSSLISSDKAVTKFTASTVNFVTVQASKAA